MEILKVIVLGVIQGIAEFLPVSSSGHIVIAEHFLDIKGSSLILNIFMHFGTLIAILAVYWRDLIKVIREDRDDAPLYCGGNHPGRHSSPAPGVKAEIVLREHQLCRLLPRIDRDHTDARIMGGPQNQDKEANWLAEFDRGGMRTGSRPSAGHLEIGKHHLRGNGSRGSDRDKAARFAFLMAIPIIFGAVAKESLDLFRMGDIGQVDFPVILGTVVSAAVGYVSLRLLLKVIQRGNLSCFSYYCFAAGVCTIVYSPPKQIVSVHGSQIET